MTANTLFANVTRTTENGRVVVRHGINQFPWYASGMERRREKRNAADDSVPRDILSAVYFHLPYVPRQEPRCYLTAIGDGFEFLDVYLLNKMNHSGKQPTLWKVFAYDEEQGHEPFRQKPRLKHLLGDVFTTNISPFLTSGDYPVDCLRIYDFEPNNSFDRLWVIADSRSRYEGGNLEVRYIPDSRDGEPKSIVTLRPTENGWYSDELNSKESAHNFSLSEI